RARRARRKHEIPRTWRPAFAGLRGADVNRQPTRWTGFLVVVGLCLLTLTATSFAQQGRPTTGSTQIEVTPVRDNIYVLSGAGANIVASVGRAGVFVVDTGLEQNVEPMLAALAQLQKMIDFKRPAPERLS